VEDNPPPTQNCMLNEADTRAKLIDPAIHKRGWAEDFIKREETAGNIEIINGKPRRSTKGRIDYTLRIKVTPDSQPVALALLEAKKESLPPDHGLDQGKGYATCERLNVMFVFASNGHLFVEFDRTTGITSQPRSLNEFPSPQELRERYEQAMGFTLDSQIARSLLQPYSGGEGSRRYYQDAAIRAVFEKIARCETKNLPKRALLSLATGAGKTFIAVNLLKRTSDAGHMRRALFLCDRDELRTNALTALQNTFGADAAEVFRRPDGTNNAKNARVHIATYQTLGIENDADDGDDHNKSSFLYEHYPENFFSHIIIDECHRSAWGKWSTVLTRNKEAIQIGLTATPRKLSSSDLELTSEDSTITANNVAYFGEPVYSYELAQGLEDGFLAACEIQKGRVNLDMSVLTKDEVILRTPRDARTGSVLSEAEVQNEYTPAQFEVTIQLPDRLKAMCADLFQYLLATGGPHQKTIIFCVRDNHAQQVTGEMGNLYAQWCIDNDEPQLQPYAFKCTAASSGNDQLPDFRGGSRSHFIASTVDLLTTGVDVPCVRNIVFFRYVESPISFYQMVGRGTRIDFPTGKLMFRVYDYTNATRLFGEEFMSRITRRKAKKADDDAFFLGGDSDDVDLQTPTARVEGFDVHISNLGRYVIMDVDGRAMPVSLEDYKARLTARLLEESKTLNEFRTHWVQPDTRRDLLNYLTSGGYSPTLVRDVDSKQEFDLYDVLAELGWGLNPRTRIDRARAFVYKHEDWLNALPKPATATLKAIAMQFELGGTEGLENQQLLQVPAVRKAGGLAALRAAGDAKLLLNEAKERMFSV